MLIYKLTLLFILLLTSLLYLLSYLCSPLLNFSSTILGLRTWIGLLGPY